MLAIYSRLYGRNVPHVVCLQWLCMHYRFYSCNFPHVIWVQYTTGCMGSIYHRLYAFNVTHVVYGFNVPHVVCLQWAYMYYRFYSCNVPQVIWVQYTTGCMGSTYHMLYMGSTYHMLYFCSDYALLILRWYCTTDCNYTSAVLNRMKNKSTKQPVYVTITHIF
jgi:hypothetical protein